MNANKIDKYPTPDII